MSQKIRKAVVWSCLLTLMGMLLTSAWQPEELAGANRPLANDSTKADKSNTSDDLKPVDNMHHFMEYIYEPTFDHLNSAVAAEPSDKATWSRIKSASLILAESSILLANRAPSKDAQASWKNFSGVVYRGGAGLYRAARKKDYEGVKKQFAIMKSGCSQCHKQYRK